MPNTAALSVPADRSVHPADQVVRPDAPRERLRHVDVLLEVIWQPRVDRRGTWTRHHAL